MDIIKQCQLKTTYRTEARARHGAYILGDRYDTEFEVYRCPVCWYWHLASKFKKRNRDGRIWRNGVRIR